MRQPPLGMVVGYTHHLFVDSDSYPLPGVQRSISW